MFFITWFKGCINIEGIHPLEGGFLRRKFRKNRRAGLPLENPLVFYPKTFLEFASKQFQWISLYLRLRLIYTKIKKDPQRFEYEDLALMPVTDDETATRELFQSEVAHAYVVKQQQIAKITRGETV
jgi:hypothetical protein